MSVKKIENLLSLIEIAETNIKNAKVLAQQLINEKGGKIQVAPQPITSITKPGLRSDEEENALEVVEGYFDGENMIGDNGQTYLVPPNYASKTQLVVGDRMKWILTPEREVFKLISPVPRERVTGTFSIEGDSYVVLINSLSAPVKILKASATFAMKTLDLKIGDEIAVFIPKDATPTWGAFSSVVKTADTNKPEEKVVGQSAPEELDVVSEFNLNDFNVDDNQDYF